MKRFLSFFFFLLCLIQLSSCHNRAFNKLIGADRDEHGCLPSAGYRWSYALHDCVRVWEVGERFDSHQGTVYLLFSRDSSFVEIFTPKKRFLLSRKHRDEALWKRRRGSECVKIQNGIISVFVQHFCYTKEQ